MEHLDFHRGLASLTLRRSGFTLIELLVVLAIITVIMAITLTSQGSFNKSLILANTAYDIALSLRSAEAYGIGSRVASAANNAGYGLHFDRATPSTFILFTDTYPLAGQAGVCHPTADPSSPAAQPGNCAYDVSPVESITSYTLGNSITIGNFCAFSGAWSCASASPTCTGSCSTGLSTMDIVFARPNPDPFISVNGVYSLASPMTAACMAVSSPFGGSRYVSISASGAITANAASCP